MPAEPTPQIEINDADLQQIVRRSPLLSQVKHRALAVLERERKAKEKKSA